MRNYEIINASQIQTPLVVIPLSYTQLSAETCYLLDNNNVYSHKHPTTGDESQRTVALSYRKLLLSFLEVALLSVL